MTIQQAARFDLAAIKKAKRVRPPPRVIIAGEHGIGKTTFVASAPDVVLVPVESGAMALDVPRFPAVGVVESWEDLLQVLDILAREKHDFKWVALDSLTAAAELCTRMVCDRDFGGNMITKKGAEGFDAFARGEKAVAYEIRALLNAIDKLQARGLGVLMTVHIGLHRQGNALGADFQKLGGAINRYAWEVFAQRVDQIGFAMRDFRASVGEGQKLAKVRAIGSERYLVFEGGPAIDAKSRAGYEMPERILLSWDDYDRELNADRLAALVAQTEELLAGAPEKARAAVAKKLGGEISRETLRAVGKGRLENLIGWLLQIANNKSQQDAEAAA
jgi:hypothetical protein